MVIWPVWGILQLVSLQRPPWGRGAIGVGEVRVHGGRSKVVVLEWVWQRKTRMSALAIRSRVLSMDLKSQYAIGTGDGEQRADG